MPESKLPSNSYRKSDTPSIQETGSHSAEVHVRITTYSYKCVVVKIIIDLRWTK
jgi:hypothetical protein